MGGAFPKLWKRFVHNLNGATRTSAFDKECAYYDGTLAFISIVLCIAWTGMINNDMSQLACPDLSIILWHVTIKNFVIYKINIYHVMITHIKAGHEALFNNFASVRRRIWHFRKFGQFRLQEPFKNASCYFANKLNTINKILCFSYWI